MNPIRVMVVDDSVVVRKIVTDVLSADPDIEVVGTAVNGKVAVAPRSVRVLNMMIGTRLRLARMARTASMPFISGISMSMVTSSGLSCSSLATAILPFTAVPTTSMSGSAERTSVTILRTTTESSTTITLIGFTGVLLLPAGSAQQAVVSISAGAPPP